MSDIKVYERITLENYLLKKSTFCYKTECTKNMNKMLFLMRNRFCTYQT